MKSLSLACLGMYSSHICQSMPRASPPKTKHLAGQTTNRTTRILSKVSTISSPDPVFNVAKICLNTGDVLPSVFTSLTRAFMNRWTIPLLTVGILASNLTQMTLLSHEIRRSVMLLLLYLRLFHDVDVEDVTLAAAHWSRQAVAALEFF